MLGIIRSADTFHWDGQNIGHRIMADMRVGRGRGYGLAVSSYDVVGAIEPWQLPEPDAGLAAFFGHRDFRDYFGRHGAKATATFNMSTRSSFSAEWADERWNSVRERKVFSVFGNGKPWRANPDVDEGRFHVAVVRANIDTRNDNINPSTGWLILAEYERGSGRLSEAGPASPLARPFVPVELKYGRALVDLRRYNGSPHDRITPVVLGLAARRPLPLQRRSRSPRHWDDPDSTSGKFQRGTVDVSQVQRAARLPAIRRSASVSRSPSSSTGTSCTTRFSIF